MFQRELLPLVRTTPLESAGLRFVSGIEAEGVVVKGLVQSSETGESYRIENGYLDLLKHTSGAGNIANLTNYLPGAGRAYEPLWRVRSLNLLTGENFPNDREIDLISGLVNLERGGTYLDVGCSAGLYTRVLQKKLGVKGSVIGIDISPSMLKEAARRARKLCTFPSFARADTGDLPFDDAVFAGAVCGGTLNELADPARVLRETSRTLQPGGRLAIMGILHATTTPGRYLQRFTGTGGIKFFTPQEIDDLLAETGFIPEELQTYGAVFFAAATRS